MPAIAAPVMHPNAAWSEHRQEGIAGAGQSPTTDAAVTRIGGQGRMKAEPVSDRILKSKALGFGARGRHRAHAWQPVHRSRPPPVGSRPGLLFDSPAQEGKQLSLEGRQAIDELVRQGVCGPIHDQVGAMHLAVRRARRDPEGGRLLSQHNPPPLRMGPAGRVGGGGRGGITPPFELQPCNRSVREHPEEPIPALRRRSRAARRAGDRPTSTAPAALARSPRCGDSRGSAERHRREAADLSILRAVAICCTVAEPACAAARPTSATVCRTVAGTGGLYALSDVLGHQLVNRGVIVRKQQPHDLLDRAGVRLDGAGHGRGSG